MGLIGSLLVIIFFSFDCMHTITVISIKIIGLKTRRYGVHMDGGSRCLIGGWSGRKLGVLIICLYFYWSIKKIKDCAKTLHAMNQGRKVTDF